MERAEMCHSTFLLMLSKHFYIQFIKSDSASASAIPTSSFGNCINSFRSPGLQHIQPKYITNAVSY